jgi:hypothetical protein
MLGHSHAYRASGLTQTARPVTLKGLRPLEVKRTNQKLPGTFLRYLLAQAIPMHNAKYFPSHPTEAPRTAQFWAAAAPAMLLALPVAVYCSLA